MVIDYEHYSLTWRDRILFFISGAGICLTTAYLFYQSLAAAAVLSPLIYVYTRYQQRKKQKKRKDQLRSQFSDAMTSLSAALEAGYSVENAFRAAVSDLRLIYPENAMIILEFSRISAQISMNVSAEEALMEFAQRTKIEDIICFAEIFASVKRTGGDLIRIIRSTTQTMNEKAELLREIETTITAKKLEVTIMKLIPFGIILYFELGYPTLLEPLYHNVFGICFMTIMLALWYGMSSVADHIMNIEV